MRVVIIETIAQEAAIWVCQILAKCPHAITDSRRRIYEPKVERKSNGRGNNRRPQKRHCQYDHELSTRVHYNSSILSLP